MIPTLRTSSMFACLLLTSSAFAASVPLRDLSVQANSALGLTKSSVAAIELTPVDHDRIIATIQLPDGSILLDLSTHSVRAPGFRLQAQVADGSYVDVDPGPVRTYRGDVVGLSSSSVFASWLDEGLFARVTLDQGQEFWIQPLGSILDSAMPEHHVVYDNDDVIQDSSAICGADLLAKIPQPSIEQRSSGVLAGSALQLAQIACDADFEYFQDWGSVMATENRIESVIGTMNQQYEAQVGITHQITTIIVRTTSNDPYSSSNADTLLNQFRNHWTSQQGSVIRDVAHLFTGKNINGGVIGIAYLGAVCNLGFGYGLVESDFAGSFACVTDLSAHEIGHNWSAQHCSCNNNTMNAFITCANNFNQGSINSITNFKNNANCLDTVNPGQSVHVASITPGVFLGGGNRNKALITVVVRDSQNNPVSGATVFVDITGDITETVSAQTNAQGSALMRSNKGTLGPIQYVACVTNITGSFPYNASANVETCDNN